MLMVPPTAMTDATAHTRAGANATYWDKGGVLRTAVANALRVTYDPSDLTKAPYALVEGAAVNYALYSRDMSGWSTGTNMSNGGTVTGPFGQTARRYTSLGVGNCYVSVPSSVVPGNTAHVFHYWLRLSALTGIGSAYIYESGNGSPTHTPDAPIQLTTDWQKVTFTFTTGPNDTSLVLFGGLVDSQAGYYFDIAMAQLEAGLKGTSWISTDGVAVTRAADVLGTGTYQLSSLTENDTDDAPLWAAGAKTVGQLVRRATTHRVYECLVAHTAGASDFPEENLDGLTPKWLELRPTNKYAAFDSVIASQAVGTTTGSGDASTLVYVIRSSKAADVIALFNLDATRVTVSVVDSAGVLRYRREENTRLRNCLKWSDWFFKPISRRRDLAFTSAPYYANSLIVITVSKPASVAKVGDIVVGRSEYLGEVQWEPEVRYVDYSRVVTDAFGITKFVKRNNAKLLSCDLFVFNEEFDETNRLLALYSSTALAFVGDERFQSTIVFGFVQDSRAVLKDPAGSFIFVQIQGLT